MSRRVAGLTCHVIVMRQHLQRLAVTAVFSADVICSTGGATLHAAAAAPSQPLGVGAWRFIQFIIFTIFIAKMHTLNMILR